MNEQDHKTRNNFEIDKNNGLKVPENYDRFFVPAIGEPLAKDLIRKAALSNGEQVLDAACGTGIIARLAFDQVGDNGTVTGIDVNPGMLAVARSVAPEGAAIEWHKASLESMPFPDEQFDVVICQLGLQFVENKRAALREMRRVLKPGGRLLMNMPGPVGRIFTIFADSIARIIGPEAAVFINHVFSLYETKEIRQLINEAGFRDLSIEEDNEMLILPPPREFIWQYINSTPLFSVVAKADKDARKSLEREVVEEWQDFVEDGVMKYQQRIVVTSCTK